MFGFFFGDFSEYGLLNLNHLYLSVFLSVLGGILTLLFGKRAAVISSGFVLLHCMFYILNDYAVTEGVFQLDALAKPFILLTSFLTLVCVISGLGKGKVFLSLFFLLEALLFCFFFSNNILWFYFFFEASLVPIFFVIGIWGGSNRKYASFKFLIYTLAGSVMFLTAISYIWASYGSLDIGELAEVLPSSEYQKILWFAFFIGFAVKIPIWPFHTWLPDAHVQAPTSGSVILAGVLIKMGAYGLLKLSLPLFPDASRYFAPFMMLLSAISVIYASCVALVQQNIKKLIAYSSVAHMGFVTAGIFSNTPEGLNGAIFQVVSHGLISGSLFLCVGYMYDRTGTLDLKRYRGLVNVVPVYSIFFVFLSLASSGLPGTSGFIGEFMSMLGVFHNHPIYSAFLVSGMVLGALYMLKLCKNFIWGDYNSSVLGEELDKANDSKSMYISDVSCCEFLLLSSFVLSILLLGIYPKSVLYLVAPYVRVISGL